MKLKQDIMNVGAPREIGLGIGAHGWPLAPSKYFPGETTLSCPNAGVNVKAIRYQQSAGEPEVGTSGATYYLADNTAARSSNPYARASAAESKTQGSGGARLIERELPLQNPLKLRYLSDPHGPALQLAAQVFDELSPISRADFEGMYSYPENIPGLAEEMGLPEASLRGAIERGQKASYDSTGVLDAVAVELLKKHGYDSAIQTGGNVHREIIHIKP